MELESILMTARMDYHSKIRISLLMYFIKHEELRLGVPYYHN